MSINWGYLTSTAGLASVGAGIVIGSPFMLVGGALGAGICIAGGIAEKSIMKKQYEFFNVCDIRRVLNSGETIIYPNIISQSKDHMLISLPNGMEFSDVTKKHGVIENYFGKKVLIEETSNKKILIKMLDISSQEQDRWIDIFSKIGISNLIGGQIELLESEHNNIGQRVVFRLPPQLTVEDFKKQQELLEYNLKCKLDIKVSNYRLVIQQITKQFKDSYTIDFRKNLLPNMEFLVGMGRGEEPLSVDLGGNEFSTLVSGSSGSGKSVFLNCLMIQMILKDVIIHAIDMKSVEFAIFKQYKHMDKYANNKKDAIQVLADTYDIMQERYQELESKGCKSYADYNKKFNNNMKPILLILDEFSALMGDKKANMFLFELLSRARASNILVVICTQTPRAKILDTTIRCNIKNTICFSCETDTDSEVALGQKGNFRACRELNKVGRGFLKFRKELIEFQGYYLSDEQITKQIAPKMGKIKPIEAPTGVVDGEKVIPIPKKSKSKKIDVKEVLAKIEDL